MDGKYHYIGNDNQPHGPISVTELLKIGNEAKNRGANLVYCREGDNDWKKFNETSDALTAAMTSAPVSVGDSSFEEAPAAFLQRVRRQTSYSTLRGVLTFLLVVAIIGIVIAAIVAIAASASTMRAENAAGPILVAILFAVGGIIFAVAAWQWSIMFADMADTLIEQNRKKAKR